VLGAGFGGAPGPVFGAPSGLVEAIVFKRGRGGRNVMTNSFVAVSPVSSGAFTTKVWLAFLRPLSREQ